MTTTGTPAQMHDIVRVTDPRTGFKIEGPVTGISKSGTHIAVGGYDGLFIRPTCA